jgi:hypothetical protein
MRRRELLLEDLILEILDPSPRVAPGVEAPALVRDLGDRRNPTEPVDVEPDDVRQRDRVEEVRPDGNHHVDDTRLDQLAPDLGLTMAGV